MPLSWGNVYAVWFKQQHLAQFCHPDDGADADASPVPKRLAKEDEGTQSNGTGKGASSRSSPARAPAIASAASGHHHAASVDTSLDLKALNGDKKSVRCVFNLASKPQNSNFCCILVPGAGVCHVFVCAPSICSLCKQSMGTTGKVNADLFVANTTLSCCTQVETSSMLACLNWPPSFSSTGCRPAASR
jgi:hypothetical protein